MSLTSSIIRLVEEKVTEHMPIGITLQTKMDGIRLRVTPQA